MTAIPADAAVLQRRLFRLAGAQPTWLGAVLLTSGLGAGVTCAQMLVISQIIANGLASRAPASVASQTVLLLVLIVVRAMLTGLSEHCALRIAIRVKSSLRDTLVRRLLERDPGGPRADRTGELVTTAMDGVEKLEAFYRRFVPQAIATAVVPLVIVGVVAWLDVVSGLVLALTAPLIPVFMWLLGTLAEQRARQQWQALGRLSGQFLDVLQGLTTLTLFGQQRAAAARLVVSSDRFRERTMGILRIAFLSSLILELAASLSTALVAVGVGVRLVEGWIAFQPALAVLLLAPEFYLPFRLLGQRHHAGMEGVAAAERTFALLDGAEPCAASVVPTRGAARHFDVCQEAPSPLPRLAARSGSGIDLAIRGVSFSYSGSETMALRGVDLTLESGTLTALVGPSGAGKSTLVSLLLRFVEPSAGFLVADGRRIDATDATEWRRFIALVPQRPHFFAGTVLDNLRLGRSDATLDEICEAAHLADADTFIRALPHGYDTPLDDTAARLSGGERQRLAIARALVKGAPLVVLDEPSSSLDPESEVALTQALSRLARTRTVLVVAHRLNTVRQADQIAVLEAGRLIELGSHDALVRRGGRYAGLVGTPAPQEVA
jgi:thiol reductant ABC exporter CydD subunit